MYLDAPGSDYTRFDLPNADNVCIFLRNAEGEQMDMVCYTISDTWVFMPVGYGTVWGRYPDGNAAWWTTMPGTPGYTNVIATE